MYEDTPDQIKSTQDVKTDMEKAYPMDRLICGDVGFGKTEVAIRAAFKAVTDGKQASGARAHHHPRPPALENLLATAS
jgi:transcription-repair coupling factor (superfamily II helicase)